MASLALKDLTSPEADFCPLGDSDCAITLETATLGFSTGGRVDLFSGTIPSYGPNLLTSSGIQKR